MKVIIIALIIIVVALIGGFIGYYVKDNYSKPDNQYDTFIKQRGRGNHIFSRIFGKNR